MSNIPQDVIDDVTNKDEALVELRKLVAFFRGEGEVIGRDGDYENLTPAETAIKAMRALRDQRRQGVPDGWKLVPVEPTQAMCQAGQNKASEWPKFPLRINPIYQAMLSAAPTPPSSNAEGVEIPEWVTNYDLLCKKAEELGAEFIPTWFPDEYFDKLNMSPEVLLEIIIAATCNTPPAADAKPDVEAVGYVHSLEWQQDQNLMELYREPINPNMKMIFAHPSNDAMRKALEGLQVDETLIENNESAYIAGYYAGFEKAITQALANGEGK